MLKFETTRDSVCAGDDILTPHLRRYRLEPTDSMSSLLESLVSAYGLPRTVGAATFWLVDWINAPDGQDLKLAEVEFLWREYAKITDVAEEHLERLMAHQGVVCIHFRIRGSQPA